jgi:hypothetical protein
VTSSAPDDWFAFAPAPATVPIVPPPSRRLGAASLALGLVPFVGYVVVLMGVPLATQVEQGMFAGLGWFIVGMIVVVILSWISGVPALILGIVAIRQNRGFGMGIAGIVLGGIALLQGLGGAPALFWLL